MFENSAIQRTDTCEDGMIGLLEVPYHLCYYGNFIFLLVGDLSFHTIPIHLQDPQKPNEVSETFVRTILLALSPKYKFVHYFFFVQSMSLNMDMKMIVSRNCSGVVFSLSISRRICNVVNPGTVFHSNSIAFPSIPRNSSTEQYTWNSFT